MHACSRRKLEEARYMPNGRENTDPNKTAFTVSVDAVGTTTGISAYDKH